LEAYPDNPYRKKASPYKFGLRVLTAKKNICSNTFTKDMQKKTDLHLKQTGTKYVQTLKSLSTNIHPPSITALEYQVRGTERAEIQLT